MTTTQQGRAPAMSDRIPSGPPTPPAEAPRQRRRRHGKRAGLYAWAGVLVALLVVLIALIAANTSAVKLDWVVGSTHASLVWIILASAVLGWLLGLVTGMVVRRRTRRKV
jgi:uncharacterized integral membrane protein